MPDIKEKFEYKNFQAHLRELNRLIELKVPFAFNRISDGELFMMDGLGIDLAADGAKIAGKKVNLQKFASWDHKTFNPNTDHQIAKGLHNALKCRMKNYIIGLPCPCCCDPNKVAQIRRETNSIQSWANLLVNHNYKGFIETSLPLILDRDVLIAINEHADITLFSTCPSVKWVPVPNGVLQKIDPFREKFLHECSLAKPGSLVLIGASAAAKILIHEGFKHFPWLSFIDIGTTLNPFLKLGLGRDYLNSYWKPKTSPQGYGNRICIW
ncbi:hypothetical protein [Prochlorococcus sp. MIT 1300]|uniref:hypothetical protein n=1 Tax=Prochlorococcus sp. MIT 1300 TaxID=3096218 RepID=UPI002A75EC31|nr:hypothetical protein [Prochlorococcus sp. MIT 1300]